MKIIELCKLGERKRTAICVYDTDDGTNPPRYVIGYIYHNEEMFKQALVDSSKVRYIHEEDDKKHEN